MTSLDHYIPIEDFLLGVRFVSKLPSFLRHPIDLQEARCILARRLERRGPDFLALVRRAIYDYPGSPYRQLLKHSRCEYGDLERLVSREGVEESLRVLFRNGVYLTVEEFKGRRPVVRGSTTFPVVPAQLRNPGVVAHVSSYSSGSRGPGTVTPLDLAHIQERAVNISLFLDARGGSRWRHAIWAVPGGSAITRLLEFSAAGTPAVRWFSQVDPAMPGLHVRYRWIGRALRLGGLLARVPQPSPIHVPLDAPLAIAHWVREVLKNRAIPHLFTNPSCAVRLCQAAVEAGIAFEGAQLTLVGEPFTPARLAVIRKVGAFATPVYGSVEAGRIGFGCLAPECSDDLHVLCDQYALIQPGLEGSVAGFPPRGLLLTALRPATPLILLNVSLGDQGELEQRDCGCSMERLGWTTHLHTIRSYEKLTAGGMTFLDTDVIRILEEVLPARFGGGPTDYQLVEAESEDGLSCLRLLVDPVVGPLDSKAVANTFLSEIGGGTEGERLMELQWRQANLPRVERRTPFTTGTSKILHLYVNRPRQS